MTSTLSGVSTKSLIQLKYCTFPGVVLLDEPVGMDFPVFEHVDQAVRVRLVERHAVVEAEVMQHARGLIDQRERLRLAGLVGIA